MLTHLYSKRAKFLRAVALPELWLEVTQEERNVVALYLLSHVLVPELEDCTLLKTRQMMIMGSQKTVDFSNNSSPRACK